MLVLTRRIGESIIIGHNIKVMVTDIQGNQVRLGIEAPTEIPVHRGEIYERIKEQNEKALNTAKEANDLLGKITNPNK
ncbi:carbon storage regulator CsrA [candidate division KSB1 bacterium]|jgi:carbon storage regulator|nr:carbon storage regulator CsrA [candidate division KSB1 bacterium]